jgi:cytochrome c553
MRISKSATVAAVTAIVTGVTAVGLVHAGGDKVAFPADYAKGAVYMTLDRAENKQVREYYTSQAAIDAAKKGEPLPQTTVITVVQYAAQLDAQGNPTKDTNGRFIKTANILGYTVMEKRAGWGAEYPENVRNGEWEYQAFRADRSPNPNANLTACFNCHKPQAAQDYVFSYDKLKIAAR